MSAFPPPVGRAPTAVYGAAGLLDAYAGLAAVTCAGAALAAAFPGGHRLPLGAAVIAQAHPLPALATGSAALGFAVLSSLQVVTAWRLLRRPSTTWWVLGAVLVLAVPMMLTGWDALAFGGRLNPGFLAPTAIGLACLLGPSARAHVRRAPAAAATSHGTGSH